MKTIADTSKAISLDGWPNYRTIWRWHFYAGLFCIPFILWLATTGSIYLFRPQIERWLDRPYENLRIDGPSATPTAQVHAALAAVPASSLHNYQLPRTARSAVQVIVGKGSEEFRVYVHPQTLKVLKVVNEDRRPMMVVFRLHGELFMGDRGSMIVELAASWAIVMILTGLYLWWPRQTAKLAGIVYVRLRQGKRIFWRDLHAVTGVWVSAFALFLILTGLPWASSWGKYLQKVRSIGAKAPLQQDWTAGRSDEISRRMAMNPNMAGMNMQTGQATAPSSSIDEFSSDFYSPLDRLIPVVAQLHLAAPVLIHPPVHPGEAWTATSATQDRPLRSTVTLDGATGTVLTREDFNQRSLIDRIVDTGVAAHEGQLFGVLNQLLGLFTALGLILLSISAVVLWWRRRAVGVLGAPAPTVRPRFSLGIVALILVFSVYLPMLGASLALVLVTERFVLRRIPSARRWLGLWSEATTVVSIR